MEQTIQALTIAGHDSDGSAGMPADLHAFFADQVYGHGILTAAVAGNSHGIYASQVMPAEFIAKQFEVLAADFQIRIPSRPSRRGVCDPRTPGCRSNG